LIGHAVPADAPAGETLPAAQEPGSGGRTTWSVVAVERGLNTAIVVGNHFGEGHRRRHHRRRYTATDLADAGPGYGLVTSVDLTRRTILWQNRFAGGALGGALATAGGLVFVGESSGFIDAFAADTGRLLWHFQLGAGVNAPPVAFAAGGTEYIAVAVGGNTRVHSATGDTLAVFHLPH
jgi:outer membrane protein assembly factor BamB